MIDKFIFTKGPFWEINRLRVEYQLTSIYYILKRGDIETIYSFDILADSFKNAYVKESLLGIKSAVNKGVSLSEAFKNAGVFSPLLLSMVEIGEQTSSLDVTMKKPTNILPMNTYLRLKG